MSNARTKRLNESDKPVINLGTADSEHKLIIPQNTTANLAAITPKDVGSLAYDTTQGAVVVQTGSGFTPVGSASTPGAVKFATRATNTNTALSATTDCVIVCDTTSNDITLTLPAGQNGLYYQLLNKIVGTTHSIHLTATGGDSIDPGITGGLGEGAYQLIYDVSVHRWQVIGQF